MHKSNKVPSIPLAFSTTMKENYDSLKELLNKIHYYEHNWKICCDLKVVNILRGMKGGYPNHFCFICNWYTREKTDHFTHTGWHKRPEGHHPELSQPSPPLVFIDDIILPPLHIKLGLAKKFIALVVKDNPPVFDCLKKLFPKLSDTKIQEGKIEF